MSGRQLLALLLFGLLSVVGLLFYFQGAAAWRAWNIPTMSPSFADIRSILAGGDALRLGYDPLRSNPLDPFGRVMAYPRLWLLLSVFHLTQQDTVPLAAVEAALFFIGLFIFVDHFDRPVAVWTVVMVASPAAMLCFERGNTDLVAFFLLACALALSSASVAIPVLLIELAAFLKLYPVAALGFLLRESKKSLTIWLSLALATFALYLAVTWRDVGRILSLAPKGVGFNYGVTVLGVWVYESTASRTFANAAFLVSYLLSSVLLYYMLYRIHHDKPVFLAGNPRNLDAFRVGALIYVGTFLQGNTWNYRLIFMIFALPQLLEWIRADVASTRRIARLASICLMVSVWAPLFGASEPPSPTFYGGLQLIVDEIANWSLFTTLAYLLLGSLPAWLQVEIALFFDKYRRSATVPAKST